VVDGASVKGNLVSEVAIEKPSDVLIQSIEGVSFDGPRQICVSHDYTFAS
jgi:hypothetical protein